MPCTRVIQRMLDYLFGSKEDSRNLKVDIVFCFWVPFLMVSSCSSCLLLMLRIYLGIILIMWLFTCCSLSKCLVQVITSCTFIAASYQLTYFVFNYTFILNTSSAMAIFKNLALRDNLIKLHCIIKISILVHSYHQKA